MKEVVVVKEVYCDEVRVCGGGLEGDEGSFFSSNLRIPGKKILTQPTTK